MLELPDAGSLPQAANWRECAELRQLLKQILGKHSIGAIWDFHPSRITLFCSLNFLRVTLLSHVLMFTWTQGWCGISHFLLPEGGCPEEEQGHLEPHLSFGACHRCPTVTCFMQARLQWHVLHTVSVIYSNRKGVRQAAIRWLCASQIPVTPATASLAFVSATLKVSTGVSQGVFMEIPFATLPTPTLKHLYRSSQTKTQNKTFQECRIQHLNHFKCPE